MSAVPGDTLTCSRCGRDTGNSSQGHYWGWCDVTQSLREMHFCCPAPDGCELEAVPGG